MQGVESEGVRGLVGDRSKHGWAEWEGVGAHWALNVYPPIFPAVALPASNSHSLITENVRGS